MTMEPTREEWLAARDRIRRRLTEEGHGALPWGLGEHLTEAALGPCPPEPAPKPWKWGQNDLVSVDVVKGSRRMVELDIGDVPYAFLPDDAEAFGLALVERAQWLREHRGQS